MIFSDLGGFCNKVIEMIQSCFSFQDSGDCWITMALLYTCLQQEVINFLLKVTENPLVHKWLSLIYLSNWVLRNRVWLSVYSKSSCTSSKITLRFIHLKSNYRGWNQFSWIPLSRACVSHHLRLLLIFLMEERFRFLQVMRKNIERHNSSLFLPVWIPPQLSMTQKQIKTGCVDDCAWCTTALTVQMLSDFISWFLQGCLESLHLHCGTENNGWDILACTGT